MKELFKRNLKEVILIAVGVDENGWYVQTSDVRTDTYYAEPIESGLSTQQEAIAIGKHYAKNYELDFVVWDEGDKTDHENLAKVTYAYGLVFGNDSDLDWEDIEEYSHVILNDWHNYVDIEDNNEEGYIIPYAIRKWESKSFN